MTDEAQGYPFLYGQLWRITSQPDPVRILNPSAEGGVLVGLSDGGEARVQRAVFDDPAQAERILPP